MIILSQRESQMMDLLVQGHTTAEMAAALGIGIKAIEKLRAKVRRKWQARNIAHMATLYWQANPAREMAERALLRELKVKYPTAA